MTKGIKHKTVGDVLTQAEWEAEDSHQLDSGTEFPVSPSEGDLFYRTDEHRLHMHDSFQWLTLGGLLLGSTALVLSNDAPTLVKAAARVAKGIFGDRIQICDGTADNVEIQAAADALTSDRTRIETLKLAGSFSVAARMNLDSYTRLDLTDAKLTLADGVNDDIFQADTKTEIEVVGGLLDGNKAGQTTTSRIFHFIACSRIKVRHTHMKDSYEIALFLDNAGDDTDIGYNFIEGVGLGYSIRICSDNSHYKIHHNRIRTSQDTPINCRNETAATGRIKDVIIEANDIASDIAAELIVVDNSEGAVISNNVLRGNAIAVGFSGDQPAPTDVVVSGNVLKELNETGIRFIGVVRGVIEGNTIEGTGSTGGSGIFVYSDTGGVYRQSQYVIVRGNSIYNHYGRGIDIYHADHITVEGNQIVDCSQRGAGYYEGIYLRDTDAAKAVTYTSVKNNMIRGILYDRGIWEASYGDYNVIQGNDLREITVTDAVIQYVGTNTVVRGNPGYVTENSGTASITGAVNTVDVTHGLAATPTRVFVQAQQTGQGDYAVTAKGATTFTITFATQPGASTWNFDWRAQVGEG